MGLLIADQQANRRSYSFGRKISQCAMFSRPNFTKIAQLDNDRQKSEVVEKGVRR
jgi:hypothetical protein